jgi:hypothetical protein
MPSLLVYAYAVFCSALSWHYAYALDSSRYRNFYSLISSSGLFDLRAWILLQASILGSGEVFYSVLIRLFSLAFSFDFYHLIVNLICAVALASSIKLYLRTFPGRAVFLYSMLFFLPFSIYSLGLFIEIDRLKIALFVLMAGFVFCKERLSMACIFLVAFLIQFSSLFVAVPLFFYSFPVKPQWSLRLVDFWRYTLIIIALCLLLMLNSSSLMGKFLYYAYSPNFTSLLTGDILPLLVISPLALIFFIFLFDRSALLSAVAYFGLLMIVLGSGRTGILFWFYLLCIFLVSSNRVAWFLLSALSLYTSRYFLLYISSLVTLGSGHAGSLGGF